MEKDLRYPIGKFVRGAKPTEEERRQWIEIMAEAPDPSFGCGRRIDGGAARHLPSPRRMDSSANGSPHGR